MEKKKKYYRSITTGRYFKYFDYTKIKNNSEYFKLFNSEYIICECHIQFGFDNVNNIKYDACHYYNNHHYTICECGVKITSLNHFKTSHHLSFAAYHLGFENPTNDYCYCGSRIIYKHNKSLNRIHLKYIKWVKERKKIKKYIENFFIFGVGNLINNYIEYFDDKFTINYNE